MGHFMAQTSETHSAMNPLESGKSTVIKANSLHVIPKTLYLRIISMCNYSALVIYCMCKANIQCQCRYCDIHTAQLLKK